MSRTGIGRPFRSAIVLIACAFVALSSGSLISSVATHSSRVHHAAQSAEYRAFWHVVAGAPAQADKQHQALASDLSRKLGPIDATSTSLPAGLNTFRAVGNTQYGGVSEAIGANPFTNEGCFECGKLNATFKSNLLLAKQGNVEQVIATHAKPVDTGIHVTPLGMPLGTFVGLTGLSCLTLYGVGFAVQRRSGDREHNRMLKMAPRQMEQIAAADEVLRQHIPSGFSRQRDLDELRLIRAKLDEEVRNRVSQSTRRNSQDASAYEDQLASTLDDVRLGIEADRKAQRELGLTDSS